ncbi:MAG: hypothetical protein J6P37_06320, partial [Lachnospiraceae bacterium]|nr:hypothetical protein [Lachnospiraceae bacterium]
SGYLFVFNIKNILVSKSIAFAVLFYGKAKYSISGSLGTRRGRITLCEQQERGILFMLFFAINQIIDIVGKQRKDELL